MPYRCDILDLSDIAQMMEYRFKKIGKLEVLFALGNGEPMEKVWAMFRRIRGY
jgi:hypothetical protein